MIIKVDRNYLEINSIKNLKPFNIPNETCTLTLVDPPDFQLNKFFYKQVGEKYRWIDRLVWNEKKWMAYTENENVETYLLKDKENIIGYFELIFNFEKKDCEVAYLGILEKFFGKKYGGYLLSEAIKNSFKNNIGKVWLHTCSLDHKNALNNYLARGMEIFKSETIALNT